MVKKSTVIITIKLLEKNIMSTTYCLYTGVCNANVHVIIRGFGFEYDTEESCS